MKRRVEDHPWLLYTSWFPCPLGKCHSLPNTKISMIASPQNVTSVLGAFPKPRSKGHHDSEISACATGTIRPKSKHRQLSYMFTSMHHFVNQDLRFIGRLGAQPTIKAMSPSSQRATTSTSTNSGPMLSRCSLALEHMKQGL